jgi:membrane protein implicated in regulation of membrane protease activity
MTWSDFYLLCFLVGFLLSAIAFFGGALNLHLPFRMHLPIHGGQHVGGLHGLRGGLKRGLKGGTHLSWFNVSTMLAFLAWFGGIGYILTKHSHLVALASLGFAALGGLFAGTLVFRFMARIVQATDAHMLDWDYRLEGTVGTVSMPIREGGTGEVLFEQNSVRKSLAARSEDGGPLTKGTEIVITRYEDGVAYVKRWDEFTKL